MLWIPADHSLWIACAIFYMVDNINFTKSPCLVIAESWRGKWQPIFPSPNFKFFHSSITSLIFIPPWSGAVFMPIAAEKELSHNQRERGIKILNIISRISIPLQVLGTLQFLNLFIIAPFLTETIGLYIAVIVALIVHFILIIILFIFLSIRRHSLRMGWIEVGRQIFECSVCPGYLANVRRRATLRWTNFKIDSLSFLASLPASDAAQRRYSIRVFVAEILENSDLNAREREALMRYIDDNEEPDV